MKMLGLIGGTSWVSTIEYYRFFDTTALHARAAVDFALS
jgi:hypothetical protein